MLAYFKDENEHEVRGASLFFVISPTTGFYDVKLIDLSSFRPLSQVDEYDGRSRDQGIIKGLQNIIDLLDGMAEDKKN